MELKKILSAPRTSPANTANTANTARRRTVQEHVDLALQGCEAHEKEMEKTMSQITNSSKTNYRFKANTNAILVIIGTILIATPIAFTWLIATLPEDKKNSSLLMNLTNLNYFLGGIGIVAFVTTFYNKPQKQMTIAIADLAQLFLICNMYRLQFHSIAGRLSEGIKSEDINHANEDLHKITKNAVELIDSCIEKYARSSEDGSRIMKNQNKMEEHNGKEQSN
jgi:hypothetical protein